MKRRDRVAKMRNGSTLVFAGQAQEDFFRSAPERRERFWMIGSTPVRTTTYFFAPIPVSEETFRDLTKKRRRR